MTRTESPVSDRAAIDPLPLDRESVVEVAAWLHTYYTYEEEEIYQVVDPVIEYHPDTGRVEVTSSHHHPAVAFDVYDWFSEHGAWTMDDLPDDDYLWEYFLGRELAEDAYEWLENRQ